MKNNKYNPETIFNRLSSTIGQFKARYPKKEEWLIPSINPSKIKTFSVHRFNTSNVRMRGMAFYESYEEAMQSSDYNELCTNVGSMLCDVYHGFRSSVEEALYGIGVKTTVVWLSSDKITTEEIVWPFILVNFGCIIIMLLKNFTNEPNYETFMIKLISELKEIIGYDADFDFPFDFKRAIAIRENLGSCSRLCQDAIRFIMKKSNNSVERDQELGVVCQYLCNVLAWTDMHHFTLINDLLVKPQSPVLFHFRVSQEVENYTEACSAITSHICPQFFMCVASKVALSKVEHSRFPTLIAVAQELERKGKNCSVGADCELTSTDGADPTMIQALVKLHLKFYACEF